VQCHHIGRTGGLGELPRDLVARGLRCVCARRALDRATQGGDIKAMAIDPADSSYAGVMGGDIQIVQSPSAATTNSVNAGMTPVTTSP
jgi:hypothetical protein